MRRIEVLDKAAEAGIKYRDINVSGIVIGWHYGN